MDLGFTAEEEAFRDEVRTWFDRNLPAEWRLRGVGGFREDEETDLQRQWQRKLHEGGYAGLAWPADHGGRGAPISQQLVYLEEYARANAPYISVNFVGLMHAGPTLIAAGSTTC